MQKGHNWKTQCCKVTTEKLGDVKSQILGRKFKCFHFFYFYAYELTSVYGMFQVGSLLWYTKFVLGRKNAVRITRERKNQNYERKNFQALFSVVTFLHGGTELLLF